jgi:hypothetical protein
MQPNLYIPLIGGILLVVFGGLGIRSRSLARWESLAIMAIGGFIIFAVLFY